MKNVKRMLSALLVVLMLATLVPAMAFAEAAEAEGGTGETAGLIDSVTGLEIPTYAVYCKLSNNLPASYAKITLTNQLTGETKTYNANGIGLALIPKSLLGVYNVSATCAKNGVNYKTLPGLKWTMSILPEFETLVLYPSLDIGLNYSDHFSYMIGYNDGTIRPNNTITRGEAASMIFRLLTPEARDRIFTKDNKFSDVNAGNPHNNAISSLAKAGIINGYADGTFRPNETVNREQFCAIIGRMFSVEYIGSDLFGDLTGGFADKYINLLAQLGIIKGDLNGNANPKAPITRAQAATILNRLLGRIVATDSSASCAAYVKTWSDCPASMWCYGDILEATNSHNFTWATDVPDIVGEDPTIREAWTNIRTDTPNWADLQK